MTEPPRKRVRTGCLTCRRRRRKCDERRPVCENCTRKGLSCEYGRQLTFVPSKLQHDYEAAPRPATSPTNRILHENPGTDDPGPNSSDPIQYFEPHAAPTPDDGTPAYPQHLNFHSAPSVLSESGPAPANDSPATLVRIPSSATYASAQHSEPSLALRTPDITSGGKARRQRYEVELFTHYCYHVAPVLDLGLGSLSFGVQATLDSNILETTYHAILALASSHRASSGSSLKAIDEATSLTSAYLAQSDASDLRLSSNITSRILLLYRTLFMSPIESWSSITFEVLGCISQDSVCLEDWQVLSRLYLTISLTQEVTESGGKLPPPPYITFDGREYEHLRQLSLALWLLEQIRDFASTKTADSATSTLAQTWLTHWQEIQAWLVARSDDMQPVLQLEECEVLQHSHHDRGFDFPCIAFGHASAIIANVAHHLACLILLQRKPRLIKPRSVFGSSTSPPWHAQRAIGIVASAANSRIWDPFLVTALIYSARHLSHENQVLAVRTTLKQIEKLSGLKLQNAINDICG